MKKHLTPFLIPVIAIVSYHLQNHSLEIFAVFAYWSLMLLTISLLFVSDFLKSLREKKSIIEKIAGYSMWAAHLYVLYIGFTYTIIMVVIIAFIMKVVKDSDYKGHSSTEADSKE
jgi:hypothetical protein